MGPKNKPNGFLMFANEIKNKLLMEGNVIQGTQDLISAASPYWEKLAKDEKQYYKDSAKWEWENRNKNPQRRPDRRQDNTGTLISSRVDYVKVVEDKRRKERQDVYACWPVGEGVLDERFYFVHFVTLLDSKEQQSKESDGQALEVAAVEFTLRNGIQRTFHKHINPGPIRTGFRSLAQDVSAREHKLPVTGIAAVEDTYTRIFDELFHFLSRGTSQIPPIHTRITQTEKTEKSLNWLAQNAGRTNHLRRVYELEGLMLDLDSHLRGDQYLKTNKSYASTLLDSTSFDWDSDTCCEWHEENNTKYCALGFVNRYCFCIANYFCETYDILATENHLPKKSDEIVYTLIPSTTFNSRLNKRDPPKKVDDVAEQVRMRLNLEEKRRREEDERRSREESEQEERKRAEQKRWAQLRGGATPNAPIVSAHQQDNKNVVGRGARPQTTHTSISPPRLGRGRGVLGRGRGMGRGMLKETLRKPGEAPRQPVEQSRLPGRRHPKENEVEQFYANTNSAPHPCHAPTPPPGWVQ